ncbi:MAG: GNAT family N-acetyltransferase [Oscillospiraceae bacterium]|nr:GNAT family N-acetyltransferase [Oscillospiraceae bacterium]
MFKNIKSQLNDPKVRQLFSVLGVEYTEAIIDMKLAQCRDDATHLMHGWLDDGVIQGICGFELRDNHIYLKDLAVDEDMRECGIGSSMLVALQEEFNLPIKAETDDDAVEFYRKIGFEISDAPPRHGTRRYALYRNVM